VRYNPELAAKLLAEAGWKERNSEGWLVKDGKIFELTLEYGSPSWTRVYSPLKESIEEAGIKFNLKQVDWRTILKKKEEHNFTIVWQAWRSGLFPYPEAMWKSDLADKKSNNNVPGFKNKRVDELCEMYKTAFEVKDRVKILREVDSIVFNEYCYAYSWYSGFSRPLHWDKFGFPKQYFPRTGFPTESIWNYWWYEPDKIKALEEAMKNNTKLPQGEIVHKPWEGYKIPEKK
jgi:ABC-type transport system substrate-binding protein